MEIYVLLIAVVIEAAFAIYCICTGSRHKKAGSIARIASFGIFAAAALLSVIKWGIKWYGMAVLLFIWAVLGLVTLIRKREDGKDFKRGRAIGKAVFTILLTAAAMLPAIAFPEYKMIETTGKYKVETAFYTYTDKSRIETYTNTGENRKLNIEFWYPKNADGKFPLVIFSHGTFSLRTSNESLYNELASHGYIVGSIDHTYHSMSTTDVDGKEYKIDRGYMQEFNTHDAQTRKKQSLEYFKKWMGIRTGDIDFVIDKIHAEAVSSNTDEVYRLTDAGKIGVMGHSLGGSAALGIGRSRSGVNAVIALESPFLCDIKDVVNDKYVYVNESYPVPVLNVYSDSSWEHLDEWAQYAENYAVLNDSDQKTYDVHIKGAGHLNLTDLALTSPILTNILNGHIYKTDSRYCLKTINKLTLDFFDCYLKNKGMFRPEKEY